VVRKLADDDHEQEDAAGGKHREDDLLALLGGRHVRRRNYERIEDGAEHVEKLPHAPLGVRGECSVDGVAAGGRPRGRVERRRVRVEAKRGELPVKRAPAQ